MPGIYIGLLEMGKDKLTGRGVVAMRSKQHVRELKLGGNPEELLRLMVLGSINDDHRVLAPSEPLPVKPLCPGPEEKLHHLRIGVSLRQ